jgi:hypothetical protein
MSLGLTKTSKESSGDQKVQGKMDEEAEKG